MSPRSALEWVMRYEPVRYLLVGGTLFLVDLAIVLTLVEAGGVHPGYAQFVGRAAGALLGFVLHRSVTFRRVDREFSFGLAGQGGGYVVVGAATLFGSPFVLMAFLALLDDNLVLAKIVTEGFLVLVTYLSMKFIFRKRVAA